MQSQLLCSLNRPGLCRIKPIGFAALRQERLPLLQCGRLLIDGRVVEPQQQVANDIRCEQVVEERRPQRCRLSDAVKGNNGELVACPLDGCPGSLVCAGLNAKAAILRLKERGYRPVATVFLGEQTTTVLELSQRLECLWAVLHGPDVLLAHSWHVDDRLLIVRDEILGDGALDHAANPVGWTCPFFRLVLP